MWFIQYCIILFIIVNIDTDKLLSEKREIINTIENDDNFRHLFIRKDVSKFEAKPYACIVKTVMGLKAAYLIFHQIDSIIYNNQ